MNISKESVLEALSHVNDPDLQKDIVSLNMVHDIEITPEQIKFTVELTTPACPMKEAIHKACVNAIKVMVDKNIGVTIKMTAKTTSNRKDNGLVLPNVKNIIAVVSGKGGVGKSTVSTNLAIALANLGAKVGLLDADIYGPSLPLMMGLTHEKPNMISDNGKHKIEPIVKYGVKNISIGLLVDESQAIVWRGPMASSAMKQLINDVYWGELDYLIIDMPPGTGDIHLTMVQTVPVTGAIVVTTPQDIALADAKKAIGMFTMGQINVPILGIVENMAYFTPAELPNNKYYIFGKGGAAKLSEQYNIPVIAQLPLIQSIREGGDNGAPAATQAITKELFNELAQTTAQQVAIRNAQMAPTQTVAMN